VAPSRKTFYEYFKKNMDALGAPCPRTLFDSAMTATATIKTLVTEASKYGPGVTVAELAVAGTGLEQLGLASAGLASLYIGACIGSLAVATGRSLSGGYSIQDLLCTAHKHGISSPYLDQAITQHVNRMNYSTIFAV